MKQDQIFKQIGKRMIYHICFSVYNNKYLFTGEWKKNLRKLIIEIAASKNIRIIEFKIMPNHVHILLEKKEKQIIPTLIQYIKGITAYKIFKKYPQLRRDMRTMHLWTSGYWAVEIKTERQLENAINYIKNNNNVINKLNNISPSL